MSPGPTKLPTGPTNCRPARPPPNAGPQVSALARFIPESRKPPKLADHTRICLACNLLGRATMRGFVRDHHLVSHARLIVREFGLRAYLRCVLRALIDRRSTFLRGIH